MPTGISSGSEDARGRERTESHWEEREVLAGCSAAARVGVVAVPVTISTVRERKGLAFPVPRAILLASFI